MTRIDDYALANDINIIINKKYSKMFYIKYAILSCNMICNAVLNEFKFSIVF